MKDEADLGDGGHQEVRQSGANPNQAQPGEAEALEVEHHVCYIQPHEPKHGPAAPHHLPHKQLRLQWLMKTNRNARSDWLLVLKADEFA